MSLHALERFPEDWQPLLLELGERPYRARQVFRWLHARGEWDPAGMTDLPKALRESLGARWPAPAAELVQVHRARDDTRKLVLEVAGGARVECVLIPMTRNVDADAAAVVDDDADEPEAASVPLTLCVSTQVGCAMGCVFCASGQAGLMRGLSAAEVVAQVLIARRHVESGEVLRNLVFMGMGEPLHHYDSTARAIRLLTHPEGIGMSPRRITVSTVGLVPGIRRLGEDFDGKLGLAVSLHAPNDRIRERIVPMNQRYSVAELMAALRSYPLPRRRRITIEYTLIAGVNDRVEHAEELARLLGRLPVKVNLIPMNSIEASELSAPSSQQVQRFQTALAARGISCFVRARRGDDVSAACGQLALQGADVPLERLRGLGRRPSSA